MNRFYTVLAVIAIVLVVIFASTFTVGERERAIKLELGNVVSADYEPGIHAMIPLYQTVYRFDDRVLTMDSEPDRVLTSEKKNLIVDAFVKWEIVETVKFFESTGGNESTARDRLHQFAKNQLYDEFGKRTVREVVSTERAQIMNTVQKVIDEKAKGLGVNVVDVRVKKVELPKDVRQPVYQRMEQERKAVAQKLRSEGEERAQEIRAKANREAEEIRAQAYKEAETIRGEGDQRAAAIYAKAYEQDPEFYAFYRSLVAYDRSFAAGRDTLVLEPDSEFFEYFGNNDGRGGSGGG
jgi:membrane protease subunit HflC